MATISIVVPVLNERDSIVRFLDRMSAVEEQLPAHHFEYVFVNDGSTDDTISAIREAAQGGRLDLVLVDLSRNFGKEAALTAGLDFASGDAVIPIDVDLQDPPEIIPKMLEAWEAGFEVVVGRRSDRTSDSWLKRTAARAFYATHNRIAHTKIPQDVGDFRVMDRKVVEAIKRLPERRRFMKGLFAWVGFRTAVVDYVREPRAAGRSKFSGWRLWNFALEGVTGFSTVPLELAGYLGFVIAILSFLYGAYLVVAAMMGQIDVPGYASILVAILFLGGLQLLGIGILGQYLGRAYLEAKLRPIYITRLVERSSQGADRTNASSAPTELVSVKVGD
jgi:glycosyltransferase involved in cell wall biosynthesis